MAWSKEQIIIELFKNDGSGDPDTSDTHVVRLQPIDQSYPTGAIDCSQCTSVAHRWQPDSDLSETMDYDLYVDGVWLDRKLAKRAVSAVG